MSKELRDICQKFDVFMENVRSDPSLADDSLLLEACKEVEDALSHEITPEVVHLADDIYRYMGQVGLEKRISLHRKYLYVVPNLEERFWSHWHLVDTLAILRRNREAVEEQSNLYHWTCQHLTDEHVLRALEDTTQARCWQMEGRINEWFQLYYKTSERLESPEVSRYWRCLFVRAGAAVFASNGRLDEALTEVEKLERYNEEDPDWKSYRMFWLAVITTRLEVHRKQEDWSGFDQVVAEAISYVKGEVEKLNSEHGIDLSNLAWVAHDVGVCLMWAGRYEQAKYLLQVAIDSQDEAGTHFFLAACIWASEKDREKTLHHLKSAQSFVRNSGNRGRYYYFFLETPEFSDVKDDGEFLEALGQR